MLGPSLFCLYINYVQYLFVGTDVKHLLYADDLQIYIQTSYDQLEDAMTRLSIAAIAVSDWAAESGLRLNQGKTQAIFFASKRMVTRINKLQLPGIVLGSGVVASFAETVKSLGVVLDRTTRASKTSSWGSAQTIDTMAHSQRLAQEQILNWAYAQPEEEINDVIQALGLNQSDLYAVNMLTMVKWLMGDYSTANFVPEPELSEQQAYTKREQHRRTFIDSVLINKFGSIILDPNVDLDHPHLFTTLRKDPIVVQKLSESRRGYATVLHHKHIMQWWSQRERQTVRRVTGQSSQALQHPPGYPAEDQVQQQHQQQMDLQRRQQQHQQQI